jgi:hypothetical protein
MQNPQTRKSRIIGVIIACRAGRDSVLIVSTKPLRVLSRVLSTSKVAKFRATGIYFGMNRKLAPGAESPKSPNLGSGSIFLTSSAIMVAVTSCFAPP